MSENIILNLEQIKNLIPHRHPFLFIKEVEILDFGKEAIGKMNIEKNDWFLSGHFPNYPIMPGVLIIESMAQTAAVCAMHSLSNENHGKNTFFLKINNAVFKNPVLPNNKLKIYTKLVRKIRNASIFDCIAKVEDNETGLVTLTSEAQIMAMIEI